MVVAFELRLQAPASGSNTRRGRKLIIGGVCRQFYLISPGTLGLVQRSVGVLDHPRGRGLVGVPGVQ